MPTADTANVQSADPAIQKAHAALFDMWFPLEEFALPPAVKAEIGAIADKVSAGMLEVSAPGLLAEFLGGMTDPTKLPF